ncbi:hypothetical protein AO354_43085 [Pseudomonas syringae pv. syringae]|nr:hypothetical protein AO354_43085 [Pseudomonas syringae pv. syringae]
MYLVRQRINSEVRKGPSILVPHLDGVGQHSQPHALCITRFAFLSSAKAMLNALHLSQILIGKPMAFTALRKINQHLFAARENPLLHYYALPQRANPGGWIFIHHIHAVFKTRAHG